MEPEPTRPSAPDAPAGLPTPMRVLLLAFAVPLIIVGVLLLAAAVRDIAAAPMAVLVIAIAQVVAGAAMAVAAARGRSRFWGGESVSSILLPLVGALALVTAYDRSGQAARALGISEPAAATLFLIIAAVAIFAAIALAWRRGVSERRGGTGSGDAR